MKAETKKIIASIIAGGGLAAGAFTAVERANCDYVFQHKGEELCVTEEVHELMLEKNNFNLSTFQ